MSVVTAAVGRIFLGGLELISSGKVINGRAFIFFDGGVLFKCSNFIVVGAVDYQLSLLVSEHFSITAAELMTALYIISDSSFY